MSSIGRRYLAALAVAQAVRGAALVMHANRTGSARQAPPPWVVKALGVRLVGQGVAELAWPRRATVLIGAAVDLTHAGSMLIAAAILPPYRRAALGSAAGAAASAAAAGMVLRNWT
ncbi:MAG TPA: hypothetical protein VFG00_01065 [Acidothermaceae bacterium]|nr:hypothetical protein [Acidothermaceae bacterium]